MLTSGASPETLIIKKCFGNLEEKGVSISTQDFELNKNVCDGMLLELTSRNFSRLLLLLLLLLALCCKWVKALFADSGVQELEVFDWA